MYELHSQASLTLRLVTDAKAKRGSGLIAPLSHLPWQQRTPHLHKRGEELLHS